jgi:hypothetical protein
MSRREGNKWKEQSMSKGSIGRSGGMTRDGDTRRRPQYRMDIRHSSGVAVRER